MQKLYASLSPNLARILRFSTAISSPPDFLASYLVTKCGFSPDKAARAAELTPRRVRSPDQPDSIIDFFKSHGFTDSHLKRLLSKYPQSLALSVEEALVPKFHAFHELGFRGDDLITLICSNPHVLKRSIENQVVPMLKLWRSLVGSHSLLMKCFRETHWQIISCSLHRIQTNISLLRDLGFSHLEISTIVSKNPHIITQKPELLNKLVVRAENLGIPRGSHNFHMVIYSLSKAGEGNLLSKVELLTGFGWSKDDFAKAFRRMPFLVTCSLKVLEEKMEFLLKDASCTSSYIALNPVLLTLSLEKRLVPRLGVLKALKEKGLSGGNHKLATIMSVTNKKFSERYVDPHKDVVSKMKLNL